MTETRYFIVTPATLAGLGEWAQIEIANPPVRPVTTGDVVATHVASGTVLPHRILANTASRLRVAVSLHSPAAGAQTIRLDLSDTSTAHTGWPTWCEGDKVISANVGPSINVRDGTGTNFSANPMDQWIHPDVLRVPTGSWMKYKNATERDATSGTVTHIRIDTPYPSGDSFRDRWENPYLLYATDGLGETWYEWNASINPLQPWPGGTTFNSDPFFEFNAAGNLVCFWRGADGQIQRRIVSGTSLADAAAGTLVEPAYAIPPGTGDMWAPSIVKSGSTWFMFYRASDGSLRRQQSSDEGASWTSDVEAIKPTALGAGEWSEKYWHGSVTGPFSGWYYATLSSLVNEGAAMNTRLFRSESVNGPWEGAREYAVITAGTMTYGLYQGCVFQRSDDSLAIFTSGYYAGGVSCAVGVAPIAPTTPTVITQHAPYDYEPEVEGFYWDTLGHGNTTTSNYDVDNTTRGTVVETSGEAAVIEYQLEYSTNGSSWTVFQVWAEDDRSHALNTTALPNGTLYLRAKARDAGDLAEATGAPITVTVFNAPPPSGTVFLTAYNLTAGAWVTIPVSRTSGSVQHQPEELGDRAPAFDGSMLDSVRREMGRWTVETRPVVPADRDAILAAVRSGPLVPFDGLLMGEVQTACAVSVRSILPANSAERRWVVTLELLED